MLIECLLQTCVWNDPFEQCAFVEPKDAGQRLHIRDAVGIRWMRSLSGTSSPSCIAPPYLLRV